MSQHLGKVLTTAATNIALGTIPACEVASLAIIVTNPTRNDGKIKVYLSPDTSPSTVDLIEAGAQIPAGGRVDLDCIKCFAGEKVYINCDIAGVVVRADVLTQD